MNFDQLNKLSHSRVTALFGLVLAVLAELLFQVLPELERRRAARSKNRLDRKRRYVTNDGYPREVTPLEKVLMILIYLRHNVRHEVVGAMFNYSADTSENAFHEVAPVERDLCPATRWEAEQKWRRAAPEWTPEEVDFVIVDSFETPVRRPSVNERQKRIYSGQKKRHTLKTQIPTDQAGESLRIEPGHRGPPADLKLYAEQPLPPPLSEKKVLGDQAYQNREYPELTTPHKKPKGGVLTEAPLSANKQLAPQRVHVEHGIRRPKAFRILRDDDRLALGPFPLIASAVVGLIQFSRILT
jgi:hypothetical protein